VFPHLGVGRDGEAQGRSACVLDTVAVEDEPLELAVVYKDLGEGAIARLTQLLLISREAAITPLQQEIEAPLITTPAGQPTP
jgi:hypothetical protein